MQLRNEEPSNMLLQEAMPAHLQASIACAQAGLRNSLVPLLTPQILPPADDLHQHAIRSDTVALDRSCKSCYERQTACRKKGEGSMIEVTARASDSQLKAELH